MYYISCLGYPLQNRSPILFRQYSCSLGQESAVKHNFTGCIAWQSSALALALWFCPGSLPASWRGRHWEAADKGPRAWSPLGVGPRLPAVT